MVTESAPTSTRVDLGALRRRAAQHELLELLVLRQRAVVSGVAGTIVLGLLLTLVAPGMVPSTALVGLVVGLLALAVGFAAAVVVHRQDPVLRAPGQARWDGSSVMAWVPSLDDDHGVEPALEVIRARLRSTGRQRLLLVDGGAGARAAGVAIGGAAAAAGIRTLLVDLTDTRPQPGMAAVGDGTVRLAEAVEIAEGRRLARIGAGRRVEESVTATVATLERPNRDLELAVVVAPDDAAGRLALLRTVDRAVLVVQAGARQRAAVRDRLQQFDAGVTAELLLVGGHLTDAAVPSRADESSDATSDATSGASPTATGEPVGPPPGPPPQVAVLGDRSDAVAPPTVPPPAAAPPGTAAGASTPTAPPPGVDSGPHPVDGGDTSSASSDGRSPSDGPPTLSASDRGVDRDRPAGGHGGSLLAATQLLTPVRDEDVEVIDLTSGAGDVDVATIVEVDAEDGTGPRVTTVDESWRLRSFRADDDPMPVDDGAVDEGSALDEDPVDDGATPVEGAPEAAASDDGPSSWEWLADADAEPAASLDVEALADGHVEPEDEQRASGNGSPVVPGPLDLAGPGDLVTTATLEFLATGDRDAER